MPRKKKSSIEILIDILEGSELTTNDLQWINKIVVRRLRNREVGQKTDISFPREASGASKK